MALEDCSCGGVFQDQTWESHAVRLERLSSLITEIYDAALEPQRWPSTLEQVCRAFDASAVNITIMDGMGLPASCLTYGIPPELEASFLTKYSRPEHNPVAHLARTWPLCHVRKPDEQVWQAFKMTEMYQELYRPLGVECQGLSVIDRSDDHNVGLAILFRDPGGLETDEELQLARVVAQHLRRSIHISLRMELLGQENRVFAETLHGISSVGVVLVDAAGSVMMANAAAEGLARERDGFTIGPSGLMAATSELTEQIRNLVITATSFPAAGGLSTGGTIRLTRPSGRRPLLAIVSPVGESELSLIPRRPAALVLISDPERQVRLAPELLSDLFGLTRREGQIAALLAEGASLGGVAERLGISRGTAHTHLKRILEKTDTHRQAELVSLLLRGLAGLGR